MGDNSAIQWTDATWNPVRGCTRVSTGCEHCYAEGIAARFSGTGQPYEGLATMVNGHPRWTNAVRTVPAALDLPLHWKRPRRIFVNSMSDLFHEDVPETFIQEVFGVMYAAHQHTFQVLTKRPERMAAYLKRHVHDGYVLPAHIWLGTSVENQAVAEERIPWLLETPAAVRFLSCEPLLEPLDLTRINMIPPRFRDTDDPEALLNALTGHVAGPDDVLPTWINWVIVGGESGAGARPMELDWALRLIGQCETAGVAPFVKQLGSVWAKAHHAASGHGSDMSEWPAALQVRAFPREAVPV